MSHVHNQADEVWTEIEPERYELYEPRGGRVAFDRRDFLRVLGGGLLIAYLLDHTESEAQQPGRRQGFRGQAGPQDIGAWLHIAEDGTISVYTGKAEVGQNIRTSLTQVVAEELGVEAGMVRMVMADTQLTPFDMGTFGSRTTPDMSRRLRRTAAAAREVLIELAAERWKTSHEKLIVAESAVVNPETGARLEYGKLTQGQKLTKTVSDSTPIREPRKWTIAGQSLAKVNGRDFVTGRHRYASDMSLPGMLHARLLRAPSFGAALVSVELAAARAMPDVVVVQEGDFVGVAAASEPRAARALAAIKAEWKPGPAIASRTLFEDLRRPANDRGFAGGERDGRSAGNKGKSLREQPDSGATRLEQTYTGAYIAHAPLEPRAAVASWEGGKLTVWTGTQRPFGVRSELAAALRVPEADIRVIVPDTGSGYGGKHTGEAAVEAARLARAAGKPVKLVWTREEEFTWAYYRPAGVIDIKSSASREGLLTAWDCQNYNSGGSGLRSPYSAAQQATAFHPSRSPLRQGSYRALASTANHFARESHMDELAHALGIDPLQFRLRNLKDDRLRAVLEAAATAFGWGKPADAGRGVGLACGTEKGGYVATCAEVAVDRENGRVAVVRTTTAFECGAVVNPDHLKNQVEGAVVMGLGGALFEAIEYENGRIQNPRFSRYRVPRFRDTPQLDVVLVDRPDLPAAGAGEAPIIAIAPAVGNAIFAAVGVRLRSLPMVPQRLKI